MSRRPWRRVVSAVAAWAMIGAGLETGLAAVTAPADHFTMPEHVYVLPVLLVPADQRHLVEAGDGSGVDLSRQPFEAGSSWHSQPVDPGAWIALTVEFPEEVELGSVKVHTGHSAAFHQARLVQVERRCVCGTADTASCEADSAACTGQAAGGTAFEFVRRVVSGPDELVTIPAGTARIWKVAIRTPNAAEQPGDPGHLTVRGLRFFRPDGLEIFPARFHPDDI